MKPEPLNGKYEKYEINLWLNKREKQRLTTESSKVLEDVKLAVSGLLEWIYARKREIKHEKIKLLGEKQPFFEKMRELDEKMKLIETFEMYIKYWFSDVLEVSE